MAPADYSWGVQEDSHTAPKALRQGSGGAAPSGGLGAELPCGGSRGRSPPENFAFLEANYLTRKCLN